MTGRQIACLFVAVVAVVAAPAVASAQSAYSFHGVATTNQGWTSNINNDANDDDPLTPEAESGFFGTVSPGALFTFVSPKTTQEVSYGLNYTYSLDTVGGDSLSHTLAWAGQFQTSPRTGLNLDAGLSLGQTTPAVREADLAAPGFQPPVRTDFRQVFATEAFEFQLSPFWRVRQGLQFSDVVSEPAGNNIETSARSYGVMLGGDRTFKLTTLGLQGRATRISLLTEDPLLPEARVDQTQANLSAEVVVTRTLSARWRADFRAGAVRTISLDDEFDSVTNPSGAAGVTYSPDWGSLRLGYTRAVGVDPFLAQNTSGESLTLNGWAPLWRFDQSVLVGGANVSYGRFRALDLEFAETQSAFDSYGGGTSVTWTPMEEPYGLSLNYTYFQQTSDQDLPTPLQEFSRHTVTISAFGRLPYRRAGSLTALDQQRAAREGAEQRAEQDRLNQRPGF